VYRGVVEGNRFDQCTEGLGDESQLGEGAEVVDAGLCTNLGRELVQHPVVSRRKGTAK